jgi:hypothetical protein
VLFFILLKLSEFIIINCRPCELPTSKEVGFLTHRGDLPSSAELGSDHLSYRRIFGSFQAYPLTEYVPSRVHIPVNG